jgi:hypothetical protein
MLVYGTNVRDWPNQTGGAMEASDAPDLRSHHSNTLILLTISSLA